MDIYLVRHGEAASSWGESHDPGLSELGARQARDVVAELQSKLDKETQLISSPLARARETALPLAASLSLPVEVRAAFREIPAPVPLPERQPWLRQFMQETWEAQPASLCGWRDSIVEQLLELRQTAVIFTHFLVINAAVGIAQGRAETLCFWPDNASITQLRLRSGSLELVTLGRAMKSVVN